MQVAKLAAPLPGVALAAESAFERSEFVIVSSALAKPGLNGGRLVAERNDAKWLGRVKGGKVHAYPVHLSQAVGHVALARGHVSSGRLARRAGARLVAGACEACPADGVRRRALLPDEAQWIGALEVFGR